MCDYKCLCEDGNNTCGCINDKCTYYNYPSYLNSKACRPPSEKLNSLTGYNLTFKSYSGIGYKGKNQNQYSYFSSFPYRYCKPNIVTESSSYAKYNSCCCKFEIGRAHV